MPEPRKPRRFRAPVLPRDGGELSALESALAGLGDPEKFVRRFALALALAPPPSLRRRRR